MLTTNCLINPVFQSERHSAISDLRLALLSPFSWLPRRQSQNLGQVLRALAIVDGATIVRVDQTEVPELAALVDVWNSWNRQLQ